MSKTQEHNYGRCTDCESEIKEQRNSNRQLQLTCDCGETRSIKIASMPPEKWDL